MPIEPLAAAQATPASAPSAQTTGVDQITITDFARMNLASPSTDPARLVQLQLAIISGEYGPPAAGIAGALIAQAISRGLSQ